MKPGSPQLQLCIAMKDAAIERFERHHWVDLGYHMANPQPVESHHRLLNACYWGDDDYPACAMAVLAELAEGQARHPGDVDNNLTAMRRFFVEREFDVKFESARGSVSNTAVLGDPEAYRVARKIRMGNREVTIRYRTETEGAFHDALVEKRYVFFPSCSMVYFNKEHGGVRVREPDFIVLYQGYCWQIEIDGSAHDFQTAYDEQEKYHALHDEGVILKRISAKMVSNSPGEQQAAQRRTWAEAALSDLEEWMKKTIQVRGRFL